jgi:hypothetical protein
MENESVMGSRTPTWKRLCVKLPPAAKLLVPGTKKNSLLTTSTGRRFIRNGNV